MATERQRIAFVLELGRMLHRFGASALRLEELLASVSTALRLPNAHFFSTPTSIVSSFGELGAQQTSLIRIEPGVLDLGRLEEVDRLAADVARGRLDAEAGIERLLEVAGRPAQIGPLPSVVAYAVLSGCAARFFGGGVPEITLALLIGFLSGVLALALGRSPAGARIYELVAAMMASFLARIGADAWGGTSVYVTTLAGLIVLVPGLTLTQAISELATRHLVSGTARMMAAMIAFLEIGFGVAVGSRLGGFFFEPLVGVDATPLPSWTEAAAFLVAIPSLMALFKASWRSAPAIAGATLIAFWGTRLASSVLGPELGVLTGAFALGVVANAYARTLDRPAVVLVVPALLLLVPGSVGFKSLASFLVKDTLLGIESAFSMAMVAVAIVAGLLFANVAVSPRRAL